MISNVSDALRDIWHLITHNFMPYGKILNNNIQYLPFNMSLLSDVEIKEAIERKDIQITPFNETQLEPASYDFRVGRALVGGVGIVDIKAAPHILKPGDWVELETIEEISLSTNVAGTLGIRSSITRKGIDGYCGPQIDPGYNGKLYFNLFNPSSESFKIAFEDKMCTITFFRLGKPASKPYAGHYQNLHSFPEEDIQRMIKIDSPTIADVITSVGILERTVNIVKNLEFMTNCKSEIG